ncbi:hypothetical protein BGZ70_005229 [Mortierella alpina]|uniref:G domain-containing protein n=1 Tax=Mortierella alpina TaxID=64518 RepID=A0A9P6J9R9_MORAP|nr:hypothetical protein BGZ70_005229 [Mortierella alpina]
MSEPTTSPPTYNIVLLGPTQSGKSTFVQSIRKYVDPTCSVDRTNIDCTSTPRIRVQQVQTDFPEYCLFTQPSKQVPKREIDLDKLTRKLTSKYSTSLYSSLFRRTSMENLGAGVVCQPMAASPGPMSTLNIVDAPPLDGIRGEEVRHVANVLSNLRRLGPINLVLIMVSSTAPITVYNADSLRAFADICQDMGGLIAFVHTKARLQDLSCSKWEEDMQGRKRTLETIFSRNQHTPLHFVIDCDLTTRDPALIAIRQRIIQKILLRATKTRAVDVSNMLVSKSKKMLKVDAEVVVRFHMAMRDLVLNQTNNLGTQFSCKLQIKELERFIEDAEEFIGKYDSDAPVVMFETSHEDDWTLWDPFSSGREVVFEALDLPCDIVYINEECHGFDKRVLDKSRRSYKVQLTRKFYTRGTYRLQVLTTFKTQYRQQLATMRTRQRYFEETLQDLKSKVQYDAETQDQVQQNALAEAQLVHSRKEMIKRRECCLRVIRHADQLTLSIGAFLKAARAELYEGYVEECVDKAVLYFTNTEFLESAEDPEE